MSLPRARPEAGVVSEFLSAILGAFSMGLPIAAAIIWICS